MAITRYKSALPTIIGCLSANMCMGSNPRYHWSTKGLECVLTIHQLCPALTIKSTVSCFGNIEIKLAVIALNLEGRLLAECSGGEIGVVGDDEGFFSSFLLWPN